MDDRTLPPRDTVRAPRHPAGGSPDPLGLLDRVHAAVIATDLDGTVIHWNRHAEGLYGWSREEALGRNAGELIVSPAHAEAGLEIMERLRAGAAWEGEFPVVRRDGSTLVVRVLDSLLYDDGGRPAGVVGVSIPASGEGSASGAGAAREALDALAGATPPSRVGAAEPLTEREREVLGLLVRGTTTDRELAERLVVSHNTVKYHLANIMRKLGVGNRAAVVGYALRAGLVERSASPEGG